MPSQESRVLNGRYELGQRLGGGSTADVYMAADRVLGRTVTVRLLLSEYARDSEFVERFRREAQVAASLAHPNLLAVFDWGSDDGDFFIVMETFVARTLRAILDANGALPIAEAAAIASELATAIEHVHRSGALIRDLTPASILIDDAGNVKVAYYGLAPLADLHQAAYMSPEQAEGKATDTRSDLYTLGVVMYEMASARTPHTGVTAVSIAYKHVSEEPLSLRQLRSDVPAAYESVVSRLLAKNPDGRHATAADVRRDLAELVVDVPARRSPQQANVTSTAATSTPRPETTTPQPATVSRQRSVFLSYSRRDMADMQRVKDALEAAGINVWTDAHLVPGTPSWTRAIQDAIEAVDGIVVVLSPAAKDSEWVEREVSYGQTRSVPIYPVLAVGTRETAVPFLLIQHQFVDMALKGDTALEELVITVSAAK